DFIRLGGIDEDGDPLNLTVSGAITYPRRLAEMSSCAHLENIKFDNPDGNPKIDAINQMIEVFKAAQAKHPENRPTMGEVAQQLRDIKANLDQKLTEDRGVALDASEDILQDDVPRANADVEPEAVAAAEDVPEWPEDIPPPPNAPETDADIDGVEPAVVATAEDVPPPVPEWPEDMPPLPGDSEVAHDEDAREPAPFKEMDDLPRPQIDARSPGQLEEKQKALESLR